MEQCNRLEGFGEVVVQGTSLAMNAVGVPPRRLSSLPALPLAMEEEGGGHHSRKGCPHQNSCPQVASCGSRHKACHRRPHGAAQVTSQSQQGEHGGAAVPDGLGGHGEGARPKDSHGEATDAAGHQGNGGDGGEGNHQVAGQAQQGAEQHELLQLDSLPEAAVADTGNSHQQGKEQGTRQIAHCLGHPKSLLGKGA